MLSSISARPGLAFVAAAVILACGVHVGLFALGVEAPPEGNAIATGLADSVPASRLVGLVCAVIASLALMAATAARTGSLVAATTLPLGLSLFPPAVYQFATDPSTAAVLAVSLIGAACATAGRRSKLPGELSSGVVTGGALGVMPWLHISGAVLGMMVLVLAVAERRSPRYWLALAAGTMALVIAPSAITSYAAGSAGALAPPVDLLRGYGMLWLALVLSGMGLGLSQTLRAKLSDTAFRRAGAAMAAVGIGGVWLLIVQAQAGTGVDAYLPPMLGLSLLACAPLVLWIELVMPGIRSVWIWILLPVTMYSCFWVVLGPIDLNAFPYTELTRFQSDSFLQSPR